MTQPAAGWYPDPNGDASKIRWWDGTKWTEDVRENTTAGNAAAQSAPVSTGYLQGVQQQTGAPGQFGAYGQQAVVPVKDNSNLAQAGLICALVGLVMHILFFVLAGSSGGNTNGREGLYSLLLLGGAVLTLPSIILGALGLKSMKRGMAIAALIMGILGVLAFVVLIVLVIALLQSGF
jgi:hypothetical protein